MKPRRPAFAKHIDGGLLRDVAILRTKENLTIATGDPSVMKLQLSPRQGKR